MGGSKDNLEEGGSNLATLVVCFFLLWDFYLGPAGSGVRVFDLAGFFVLLCACSWKVAGRHELARLRSVSLSVGLVFLGVTAGLVIAVLREELSLTRPGLGLYMGAVTLVLLAIARFNPVDLCRAFRTAIWAAIMVQMLQVIVFYTTEQLISPPTIFGSEARINYNEFRPAGLFLEPASHCLAVVSALSIVATFSRPSAALLFSAIISVILSKSLSGILLLSALVLLMPGLRANCSRLVLPMVVGLSVFSMYLFESVQHIIFRMTQLQQDGSFLHRFGIIAGGSATIYNDLETILFGHGFSATGIAAYGLNGIGFLLGGVGAILTAFWICYLFFMSRLPKRTTLFLIIMLSLSTQIQTLMFFWLIVSVVLFTTDRPNSRSIEHCGRLWAGVN